MMTRITIVLFIIITFSINAAFASDGQLCPDITGSWYDPKVSGEGISLEQIRPGKIALYWYHGWPIINVKTRQEEIQAGGYFSGILTKSGNTWNGTFNSFKGSKGKLVWGDAFVGWSQSERVVLSDILDKFVTSRISEFFIKENTITARLTVESPNPSVADSVTSDVQLIRLTMPDCWKTSKTFRSTISAARPRLISQDNGIDTAITHIRTDILEFSR